MFYEDLEKSLAGIAEAYKKMKSQETVEEAKIPVETVMDAVTKVLGTQSATKFATHLRPGSDKHTSWDKVNDALKAQGVKTKHIADIAVHVKPAKHEESMHDDKKMDEELHGDQHKLDANKNGKLDAEDFEMLRKKKEEK